MQEVNEFQKRILSALKETALRTRIHTDDIAEHEFITELAQKLNAKFNLYPVPITVNPIQTELLWGMCEPHNGIVHVLFRWPREDYRIERRTIIRVLCHEMTHFRILGHGPEFFELCSLIIEEAKRITNDPKIKMERFIDKECATFGF